MRSAVMVSGMKHRVLMHVADMMREMQEAQNHVIPAKAGISAMLDAYGLTWIPACAGMTEKGMHYAA